MADVIRTVAGGGVTTPQGFRAGAISCGIKSASDTPDLALLIADQPCVAAATFTTSRTPAAPVLICKEHLAANGNQAQAVIVNSGNANCSTGTRGLRDARTMAGAVAEHYGIDPQLVMVSSTGIIGRPLPVEKVITGLPKIVPRYDGGEEFANAILTTDTRAKRIAVECEIGGVTIRIGGTTKGAGMIYPNMATMLCYITTDAAIDGAWLQDVLQHAVMDSFNMICVDGDMSTNDTVIVMANGMAGNQVITAGSPDADTFVMALNRVTRYLAVEIARDGEGMTKLMEVHVRGGHDAGDARKAARGITMYRLWQCALAGGDPNWGRIIGALGACGAAFDQDQIAVWLGDVQVVKDGIAAEYQQADAVQALVGDTVTITVDLHHGQASATAWGCDMTHGYIDENTLYTR